AIWKTASPIWATRPRIPIQRTHRSSGSVVPAPDHCAPHGDRLVTAQTMYDKIWRQHEIADLGDGFSLLHVDRHMLHDGAGPVLARLRDSGRKIANPDLCFATLDHVVSTASGRPATSPSRTKTIESLRFGVAEEGIRLFDVGQTGQGIVHVIGPELGISLPGSTIVC